MLKKFLYFQPEYVGKFKCDGSKCDAHCCKGWDIIIDEKTFQRYSRLEGDFTAHIKPFDGKAEYCIELDERGFCPFLDENNLCRIQKAHGENFLSLVCKTYPRILIDFGKFLELSLTLSCPVAAEMILFGREPLTFELKEFVEDDAVSIGLSPMPVPEKFLARLIDIQAAMISILQERTLSIDQRLIVLGFFLDKLEEISAGAIDDDALTKLIAAYESKSFLSEQVPQMLASFRFDVKKFVGLMMKIFNDLYGNEDTSDYRKFFDAVIDALNIKLDENNFVSITTIADHYERLADARKNFLAQYSTLLENYLVNEIFLNVYPWRFEDSISINYAAFVMMYKAFELILFASTLKGFDSRNDLLKLIDFFANQTVHSVAFKDKILATVKKFDDTFALMETLLNVS